METWLDTVNLKEIEELTHKVVGLTCNPLIIKKDEDVGKMNVDQLGDHFKKIFSIFKNKPIFLQTFSLTKDKIIEEAEALIKLAKLNNHPDIGVKIPAIPEGIEAITNLIKKDYLILATAVFTPNQAYYAAKAGARYLASYTSRATKHKQEIGMGFDGVELARQIHYVCHYFKFASKAMAAGFRDGETEINELITWGIDAITVKPSILKTVLDISASPVHSEIPTDIRERFSHGLENNLWHPLTAKAFRDFTDTAKDNSAYLELIYRHILDREPSKEEIQKVINKAESALHAYYM